VSRIIRARRKTIGSHWRKLAPGQQALLVLAYLRKGETFAELAAGFRVETSTAWRYVAEVVALVAARPSRLRRAVRDAGKADYAYMVVDGTLIPIDRVAADRPFYSGKHKRHGMNLQVIASPDGSLPVGLRCLHGSMHDKEAEWTWGVIAELEKVGIVTLADKGHQGQDPLQGQEQARIAERGQPRPREAPRTRRARKRPGQGMVDPPEATLPLSTKGVLTAS
jgi:hypothetical protein